MSVNKVSDVNVSKKIAKRHQFLKPECVFSPFFNLSSHIQLAFKLWNIITLYSFQTRVSFILQFCTEWGWGDPKREKLSSSFLVQFATINESLKQNLLHSEA